MSISRHKFYVCKLLFRGIELNTNLYRYQIIWKNEQEVIGHMEFVNNIKQKRLFRYYNVLKKIKKFLKPYIICYMSKDLFLSEKIIKNIKL